MQIRKIAFKSEIDASKAKNLNGINYRMWRRHMSCLLTCEIILYTLSAKKPQVKNLKDNKAIKNMINGLTTI